MPPLNKSRVAFLDGIRGWASIAVLLSHTIPCFLALTTPQLDAGRAQLARDIANNNYLSFMIKVVIRILTNGRFAVLIFFILSGYTLSISQLYSEKRNLALASIARYFRLMIPVISATFIAYILLRVGLFFNLQAATTPENSLNWLGTFYTFHANFKDFLAFSLYEVFFRYNGDVTYNPPLWTMQIEMLGSLVLYAYLAIFRTTESINWKVILTITAVLLSFIPLCACFCVGYLIAELNKKLEGKANFLRSTPCQIILLLMFAVSIMMSIYFKSYNEVDLTVFSAASMLVFSVSFSGYLARLFSGRLSRFLGRISFPLYLIHFPIICSWSSYLFIHLPLMGFSRIKSNYIILTTTIAMCLMASVLLLPIEKRSNDLSKKIAALFLKPF